MNRQLAYAVVADGGTDRLLVPIIQWAVNRLDPGVEILEPEFRKRRGSVAEFLAAYRTGAMLIFVHRDSETLTLDERLGEFDTVDRREAVPGSGRSHGPARQEFPTLDRTTPRERRRVHRGLQSARELVGLSPISGSAG